MITAKIVPSQRLASGELVFLAKDVPPFGGRRFTVEAGSASASGTAKADGATLADSDDHAEARPEIRRDCEPARQQAGS